MALGDYFPESIKEQFSGDNIKIGAVIRAWFHQTIPPKEKRFIIVGIDNDKISLGAIFINSAINVNVISTQELKDLQYPISPNNCGFIEHDSYIDCSTLIEKEYKVIYDLLKDDPTSHLGNISENDWKKVRLRVKSSRKISFSKKKKYNLL